MSDFDLDIDLRSDLAGQEEARPSRLSTLLVLVTLVVPAVGYLHIRRRAFAWGFAPALVGAVAIQSALVVAEILPVWWMFVPLALTGLHSVIATFDVFWRTAGSAARPRGWEYALIALWHVAVVAFGLTLVRERVAQTVTVSGSALEPQLHAGDLAALSPWAEPHVGSVVCWLTAEGTTVYRWCSRVVGEEGAGPNRLVHVAPDQGDRREITGSLPAEQLEGVVFGIVMGVDGFDRIGRLP